MDSLFPQSSNPGKVAVDEKSSRIDGLLHPFELEALNSWSATEAELRKAATDADRYKREAEHHLDSLVVAAMDDFHRSSEEMSRLVPLGVAARKTARGLGTAATVASKKRGLSSSSSRVRPC